MEALMIIIGVLAIIGMIAFLVHLFIMAYNKDQQEQDERILQLEKRIEDYGKKQIQKDNWLLNEINERLNETKKLDLRLQKLEKKKKSDNNDNNRK